MAVPRNHGLFLLAKLVSREPDEYKKMFKVFGSEEQLDEADGNNADDKEDGTEPSDNLARYQTMGSGIGFTNQATLNRAMSTVGAGETEGNYELTKIDKYRKLLENESIYLELWQTKQREFDEVVDFECIQFNIIEKPTLF